MCICVRLERAHYQSRCITRSRWFQPPPYVVPSDTPRTRTAAHIHRMPMPPTGGYACSKFKGQGPRPYRKHIVHMHTPPIWAVRGWQGREHHFGRWDLHGTRNGKPPYGAPCFLHGIQPSLPSAHPHFRLSARECVHVKTLCRRLGYSAENIKDYKQTNTSRLWSGRCDDGGDDSCKARGRRSLYVPYNTPVCVCGYV